jgi:hypothetical protein
MEVIEYDISDFLPICNPGNMQALAKNVVTNDCINAETSKNQDKEMSFTVFFLIVTLILVAILVLLYFGNRTNNPTKKVIDKHKSYGKN